MKRNGIAAFPISWSVESVPISGSAPESTQVEWARTTSVASGIPSPAPLVDWEPEDVGAGLRPLGLLV